MNLNEIMPDEVNLLQCNFVRTLHTHSFFLLCSDFSSKTFSKKAQIFYICVYLFKTQNYICIMDIFRQQTSFYFVN